MEPDVERILRKISACFREAAQTIDELVQGNRSTPVKLAPVDTAKDMLTVADTAALLQMSEKAVYTMVERGLLPVKRIGRRVFVRREALLAEPERK